MEGTTRTMKFSIITTVYNAESYIEDCISSVVNQTYENLEHIIVEVGHNFGSGVSVKFVNGSPSNMEEILTYMQDKTKV